MENTKNDKKSKIFFRILFILFILFLCVYAISSNGYIEQNNESKTLFTEEQIRKFESDVEAGREVDINEYITNDDIDYSNAISDLGENISNAIDFSANKSIDALKSLFSYLFN